ncbi:MAG TPA: bifunctional methionine sulfoxide reductase B/A protein [Phycisphaerales bacterium]|nr:bifunctional methionine sulfoxide reductase B/A protein [Phycisphaerales bacterium]
MRKWLWIVASLLMGIPLVLAVTAARQQPASDNTQNKADSIRRVVIDDFSPRSDPNAAESTTGRTNPQLPSTGRKWRFEGDRVVGGMSRGAVKQELHDNRACLHLRGDVSAGAGGGYIEARANLHPKGQTLDARAYDGFYVRFKGRGLFSLRLKTADVRLDWQSYEQPFEGKGDWAEVRLPFSGFRPVQIDRPLDVRRLRAAALAAMAPQGPVELYVDQIGFYKEHPMPSKLTDAEQHVILHKGTEPPFTGRFTDHFVPGVYTCKQCGAELFRSDSKFHSGCGWPSFDEQIPDAVKWLPDADGVRTEIICNACGGHLGHVFRGEGLTPRNLRYCVNSISMDFIPAEAQKTERAIFASGCFWGTEYHLQRIPGVISTTVGYTGGHVDNPTYKQVCTDKTGHAEAVEAIYDPGKTTYEQLARMFFETHDFTQLNRQGPDVGTQYRSAIFYLNDEQKAVSERLIGILRSKGFDVKTELSPAGVFWPAEDYHQDYYESNAKTPYCHIYRKIF